MAMNYQDALDRLALDKSVGKLRTPIMTYLRARSALYTAESLVAPALEALISRKRPRLPTDDPQLFKAIRQSLDEIFVRDVQNIIDGFYPLSVLRPENPLRHLMRMPKLFRVGAGIARRRRDHVAHEFSDEARDLFSGLPDYYLRNFHFQGDGYLSDESAELYDHQVNVLFAGATDAMRRLIIAPLKKKFGSTDGEGLTFLEVGSGTGRATLFVRLAFPKAKIVSVDLSAPYLKKAQEDLRHYPRHDFVEANASSLPFLPETFDAVYSVFLFHELPMAEREAVIRESLRVLKPNGFFGLVDSLQLGDHPEVNAALENFPREFHEPFYKNYILHPMEHLLADGGLKDVTTETGFLSKVVVGNKVA